MISSLSASQVCEATDLEPLRPVLLVPSLPRKLPAVVVAIRMAVKPPGCTEYSWRSMSGTDSATLIGTVAGVAWRVSRTRDDQASMGGAAPFPFALAPFVLCPCPFPFALLPSLRHCQ
jgi:hypothetical protein